MPSTILRKAVMAAAFSLLVGSICTADPQRPGAARVQPDSQSAVMPHSIRAKQVIGAKVNIQNNVAIGTVDDIVLSDAGDVEYLIVITSD
ncbi:MAG TPA: PRC-barrel domain-containing protein, partial [Gemmataceae bacterium]